MRSTRRRVEDLREARRRRMADALYWVDLVQGAKTVLAGALAWWVAVDLLHLEQPFLAPWSAILVVHATVFRTFTRGAQQVAATLLAVLLASLVGHVVGLDPLGMTVLIACAVLLGRVRWVRDEATTIATTGVVVLATNAISESTLLWSRLLDTGTGIVVGLLVNVVVWPPLRDRAAWAEAATLPTAIGEALSDIADQLSPGDADAADSLLARLRRVDATIDHCWGLVHQAQEGSRLNPRRRKGWSSLDELVEAMKHLELAVADAQSLVRTVGISNEEGHRWQEDFRSRLVELLCAAASAVDEDDEDRFEAVLADLRRTADDLHEDFHDDGLVEHWTEYGGALLNLRNVVDALSHLPPTPRMRPHTGPRMPRRMLREEQGERQQAEDQRRASR